MSHKIHYRDLTFCPKMLWAIKLEGYRDSLRLMVGVYKGQVVVYGRTTWVYLRDVSSKKTRQTVIKSFFEKGVIQHEKADQGPKQV